MNEPGHALAPDLGYWEVILRTGDSIRVRAHAMAEEESSYLFFALMEGTPPYEVEVMRVPVSAVGTVQDWLPDSQDAH